MRKHTLTYRITTPAFIGGSDQQAEFRLASFKGVLRFWWRALQWGRFTDPQSLKVEEDSIFGSGDQSVGRSKVRLRLVQFCETPRQQAVGTVLWKEDDPNNSRGNERRPGASYLGYGCINAFSTHDGKKAGQFVRACLSPFSFQIEIRLTCNESKCETVEQALAILGLLGGMGAKSRKGFGSLSLVDWSPTSRPSWLDLQNPEASLKSILEGSPEASTIPEWTAFSPDTRIVKVELTRANENERDLLDRIGREMMFFKSWGRGGRLNFGHSETRFWQDHDLFDKQCRNAGSQSGKGKVTIQHPQRIAFGLPHNYGKETSKHVYPLLGGNEQESRRASPLFIHIHHPDAAKQPVGYLAFFPTKFLPNGTQISSFGKAVPLNTSALYTPINEFMDRLEGGGTSGNEVKTKLKGTKVL